VRIDSVFLHTFSSATVQMPVYTSPSPTLPISSIAYSVDSISHGRLKTNPSQISVLLRSGISTVRGWASFKPYMLGVRAFVPVFFVSRNFNFAFLSR